MSANNSTTFALGANQSFVGRPDQSPEPDVMVTCLTDADGTLIVEFSIDSINWDSSSSYMVLAGTHEPHVLRKGERYCRVRFVNGSTPQTFLRLRTAFGRFGQLTSGLSTSIQPDADAITARVIGEEAFTAEGRYTGRSIVNKFGRNTDIDTGTVPEDVWNGGGPYAGFPTGAPEEFEAFSSSAGDTGQLTITYLASSTATSYSTATVTLNGTTPVPFGVTGTRMHTASYSSGSPTTFNLGAITVRHRTTTANVFCAMPIGRSQTNVCAYTVPFGSTAYMRRLFCRVIGATSGQVDGALWVRTLGGSPRLRRPFSSATSTAFEESPYGGLILPAGADVTVRISSASAVNLDVIAGFDLILVREW